MEIRSIQFLLRVAVRQRWSSFHSYIHIINNLVRVDSLPVIEKRVVRGEPQLEAEGCWCINLPTQRSMGVGL